MTKFNTAKFIREVSEVDPDSNSVVLVSMFKHNESGGIFGIDSSFIEQIFDEGERGFIADPFNFESKVELLGV